jgi:transcriptional regulator with XRE-family HTH domain
MEQTGLAGRFRQVIRESGLSQKEFAKSIKVSESYVSQVLRNGCGMSNSTACLIEEIYGFSCDWLLKGSGEARKNSPQHPLKNRIIQDIDTMSLPELKAVYAYVRTLQGIKEST